jgi:tRNA-dihydrouridine synthase B
MKLGGILIDNPFVQAPMAGVTDAAFRTIARRFHSGLLYTEMISAEGLCRANWKTLKYTEVTEEHQPVALQLVGHDPQRMAEAAGLAETLGVNSIDINAGCPQIRITSTGSGGALLKNPKKLAEMVSLTRKKVSIPVSVKMRLGYANDESLHIANQVQDAGADFITLHGRTVSMGFSGVSDTGAIKCIVEALEIPVLANGDARNEQSAIDLLRKTGAAGVMLGRATRGRPDLPGTAFSLHETGEFKRMTPIILSETILAHARMEMELFGELAGMRRMRKHITWYFKAAGIHYNTHEIYALESIQALENVLETTIFAKD